MPAQYRNFMRNLCNERKSHVMWLRFHFKRMLITELGEKTLKVIFKKDPRIQKKAKK